MISGNTQHAKDLNKIAKNEREKNLSSLILFYTSDVEYACLVTLIIHEQTSDYFIYVPKDLHIQICQIFKGVPIRKIETRLPFKFTLCQTYLQMEILVSFFIITMFLKIIIMPFLLIYQYITSYQRNQICLLFLMTYLANQSHIDKHSDCFRFLPLQSIVT